MGTFEKSSNAIYDIVKDHITALASSLTAPEVFTVVAFTGNSGSATSKKLGQVTIKSSIPLNAGDNVVGIPTGFKEFYVAGVI